ncbi:hypothetical protein SPRG_12742 [Saprolegnia parasitica CBS 223.65]|uniref:C2 domain-containing protein n=1 Tax=Saprolegnia parasitica (strain CBS 223.65) TaxID=695850 RepID=A0A067C7C7_SAPPC|nr:hypothetical protein SPRG_12742 [Saprolegnia parasitica CBS 223.65]KDO22461.1 hypothetical protein SPRG_12742 [Saprolegnia parasitica CBS 223.65]|eukprot:XP_012206849.1 hypothetical protein SPRG_12742 [Saprolegnia parasitica CBS 223.65]
MGSSRHVDTIVGRTEVRKNTPAPGFVKSFKLDVAQHGNEGYVVKIELYHESDEDHPELQRQKLLGHIVLPLPDMVAQINNPITLPLTSHHDHGNGAVLQLRTEYIGLNADVAMVQFAGAELPAPDNSGLPNPLLVIKRIVSDGSYVAVFRSEVHKQTSNPLWEKRNVPVQRLCNGDYKRPLLFQVVHHEKSTQKLIGQVTATLYDLLNGSVRSLPLRNGERFAGSLNVAFLQVANEPDYVGYAQGPCEITHLQGLRTAGKPLDQQSSYAAYGAPASAAPPIAEMSAMKLQPDVVPTATAYPVAAPGGQYPEASLVATPEVTQDSETPTQVTFINSFVAPVDIAWVDYDGNETIYNRIEPGQKYTQDTYAQHVWLLATPTHGPLAYYTAAPDATFCTAITSGSAGAPIKLVFVNNTPRIIGIAWVDEAGQEIEYAQVHPRQSYVQDTYANHVWKAHYADSNIPLVYFRGSPISEQVDIRGHNAMVHTPLGHTGGPYQGQSPYQGQQPYGF